jgi:hypothetical protein
MFCPIPPDGRPIGPEVAYRVTTHQNDRGPLPRLTIEDFARYFKAAQTDIPGFAIAVAVT